MGKSNDKERLIYEAKQNGPSWDKDNKQVGLYIISLLTSTPAKIWTKSYHSSQDGRGTYTFSKFATDLEKAFTTLRDYKEPISETDKLCLLHKKIKTGNVLVNTFFSTEHPGRGKSKTGGSGGNNKNKRSCNSQKWAKKLKASVKELEETVSDLNTEPSRSDQISASGTIDNTDSSTTSEDTGPNVKESGNHSRGKKSVTIKVTEDGSLSI
eukprot:14282601-Ditylum_brightwellii.AAC.1